MALLDPAELRKLYAAGTNIMAYLRERQGAATNDPFTILASYDLQAGSYVRGLRENAVLAEIHEKACGKFATLFDSLDIGSLLEVGVGEATTLANVVARMKKPPEHVLGFDISLSRMLVAREYAASRGVNADFFTATLEAIPLPANSVDVVYSSHSMEPNGGRERPILEELYRVARRYVVLREPSDELGGEATRAHIAKHGYVRGLNVLAKSLGYNVIEYSLFGHDPNPTNQAGWIVIEKPHIGVTRGATRPPLASPISKAALVESRGALYSPEDGLLFPVFGSVPCLLPENGVLCLRWLDYTERA